jgi:hypothetical protein
MPSRDHAVAFGSQLPPTGSVRDLHPQSIIHVQRTRFGSPGSPSLRSVAAQLPEEAKPREFLFISPFFFLALLIN